MKTMTDFIFLGSKITMDSDCSHEIKRRLLLGRKAMSNPDSILKSRDITLPTKVRLVKAMVLPVVMYRCQSWITAELMLSNCSAGEDSWVSWTARRSNQSILKKISPEYSLKGLMLKPSDAKSWLTGKDPDAGKDWGRGQEEKLTRGWDGWMASLTQWTWVWVNNEGDSEGRQ